MRPLPHIGIERKERRGEERMEETRWWAAGEKEGKGKSDRSPTMAADLIPIKATHPYLSQHSLT